MPKIKNFLARWWIVLVLVVLLPVYSLIATYNERNVDYLNNGFFTFWLSGHMQWTGEHPYSSIDWVNGHHANGATWIPNKIFPYPLPLALVTAPFGLLSIQKAYILWDVLAQLLIAGCILWLATRWTGLNRQLYVIFVLLAAILNGNIFLGLMTGTFAALFLVFLTLSLYFLETHRPLLAGVMLAGLALKPPLLTVVALIGLWLLFRRNWRTLAGIGIGGLGLIIIGLIQDPDWIGKFRGASENLLGMRLGSQPTILSYTRLLCAGDSRCAFGSYALVCLVLVGLYAWLTWRKRETLSATMAFSAAIALGVLLPPYLWSYDYVLLIIPICYIAFELILRRSSYIYSTLFLLLLDFISIIGLILFWINPESETLTIQRDMWSIWVAVLVMAVCWWMVFLAPPVESLAGEQQGQMETGISVS
ncbi:MAG TPA: glycosyltransferase family 87 protein [Anaerolineales bacterium]|jgi:hypothetical protein